MDEYRPEPLLEAKNVTVRFEGTVALDDVSVAVYPGEVLALMGENGAGKSTLMKVFAGIYQPNSGEVLVEGNPENFHSALDSLSCGIAMVHQELMTLPDMSVAENLYVGREPISDWSRLIDRKKLMAESRKALDRLDLNIDPRTPMGKLSTAERQLVEIAKALTLDPKVLILDEPTSSLSDRETEHLFERIEALRASGVGMVYISHRMDEVYRLADRITVLRDGHNMGTYEAVDLPAQRLISLMVGRELTAVFDREKRDIGEETLVVRNLSGWGVKDANISVRAGEVVGLSGLVGAGRSEVAEMIFGLRHKDGGEVMINGELKNLRSPHEAIAAGLAMVPEDRKNVGLNLVASIKDNISIASLKELLKFGLIDRREEKKDCGEFAAKLRVKTSSIEALVSSLSGGNQQKVVLAKWLMHGFKVLILDEPTRGVDVGAKFEIYQIINELAAQGVAILMISSELPEIIGLCDRTYVMYEGRITGEVVEEDMSQETIMELASGLQKAIGGDGE